jgi:hypothetical protein
MSAQLDLESWALHRRTDPDTSVSAAKRIKPALAELQQQVLAWLGEQPEGATDEELSEAFQCKRSTYRTRRSELVDMGKVRDSTRRKPLSSGRMAIVWEVVK